MRLSPEMTAKLLGKTPRRRAPLVAPSAALRLTVVVPLKVCSAANAREHWAVKARRVKAEIEAVKMAHLTSSYVSAAIQGLTHQMARNPAFRVAVTLTRLGGRKWDDDNNVSGLKGVRDGVARWWLMVDDGSQRVNWICRQEPGGAVGVRIQLEACE